MIDPDELTHRFSFHPADTEERQQSHEAVRNACLQLAFQLNVLIPDGREKSTAIARLEDVMFWANAGIARQAE